MVLTLASCHRWGGRSIEGEWHAVVLTQGADTVPADLSRIRLHFVDDNRFIFQRTQIDSISGVYKLNKSSLTLIKQPASFGDSLRYQVEFISNGEMQLRMNHDGIEQLLLLERHP